MSDQTQVTPDTSTTQVQDGGQQTTTQAPQTQTPSGLDFIPEAFRESSWAKKYTSADDFFKGVDHMSKMMGQKQVVQGLQVPGENAPPEEVSKFYQALGRPEAADKYTYAEDLKAYEGLNLDEEKKGFSEVAFNLGLSQKQADQLFKVYVEKSNQQFGARQESVVKNFDELAKNAFGDDYKANLDLAKRGAKAIPGGDKINLEDIAHPFMLQALAKLGEVTGEDSFIDPQSSASGESLKEEAMRLQKSALYQKGDPATVRRVEEIYKRLYPN